jgi:hypothetical protein
MNTQQAYINGFIKRANARGLSNFQATELLKKAYGYYSDGTELGRWQDGGPMWAKDLNEKIKEFHDSPKHVAAMTKAFADAAKRQGAELKFTNKRYSEDYISPEDAIANISAMEKLDSDNGTLPYYYSLRYPLKDKSNLNSPEYIDKWPEAHPAVLAYKEYSKYL